MNNKINIHCCATGDLRDGIRGLRELNRIESGRLDEVKVNISETRFEVLPQLRAQLAALPRGAARDPVRQNIQAAKTLIRNLVQVKENIRENVQNRRARISELQEQLNVG